MRVFSVVFFIVFLVVFFIMFPVVFVCGIFRAVLLTLQCSESQSDVKLTHTPAPHQALQCAQGDAGPVIL